MARENPGTAFIARTLAEHVRSKPWAELDREMQTYWYSVASHLVIRMYENGFTIPQPADPDAVWAMLKA